MQSAGTLRAGGADIPLDSLQTLKSFVAIDAIDARDPLDALDTDSVRPRGTCRSLGAGSTHEAPESLITV